MGLSQVNVSSLAVADLLWCWKIDRAYFSNCGAGLGGGKSMMSPVASVRFYVSGSFRVVSADKLK